MKTINARDVQAGQRLLITNTTTALKGWIGQIAKIKSVDWPYAVVIVSSMPHLLSNKPNAILLEQFTFAQPSDDFLCAMDAEAEWCSVDHDNAEMAATQAAPSAALPDEMVRRAFLDFWKQSGWYSAGEEIGGTSEYNLAQDAWNAALTAADVPGLLAEVVRLRAELAEAREQWQAMKDVADARSDISNQCLKELADANEKLATAERERGEARAALAKCEEPLETLIEHPIGMGKCGAASIKGGACLACQALENARRVLGSGEEASNDHD